MKNREIRVVFIERKPSLFGSCKSLLDLLDSLVPKGIIPLVIVICKGPFTDELSKRDIDYKIVKHYFSIYPRLQNIRDIILFLPRLLLQFLMNPIAIRKISNISLKFKADIIHTNIGPSGIGQIIAKKLNIPHVWHIREYQDLDFGWKIFPNKEKFINKLKQKNNYNIAITEGLRKNFKLTDNYRIINDGVSMISKAIFNPKKEKYFLFVGRVELFKGIMDLINSFKEFLKTNDEYKLFVVGDKNNHQIMDRINKIASIEIESGSIQFLGYRKDVQELMSKATALIVPSKKEAFGRITAEAMFYGCLVIGNNSGGTKEILEKNNLGILYTGKENLLHVLKEVANNGVEFYNDKIKLAQKYAIDLYSIENSGAKVFDYYNQIISNHIQN